MHGPADAWFAASTCNASLEATSGSIIVTAATATKVSGTFDLVFGSHGTLSGSFEAPVCGSPAYGAAQLGGVYCE